MDDVLIFDILLTSGGISQPTELFPPHNVEDLVRLLNAIFCSIYDTLKKECLVYLLLKWHQDGREERFQGDRCLPPQFAALADAYWHLDAGVNIPRAVGILSDSRLNRDYASKIIHAISLSPDPAPLILNYVRTAKPLLVEPVDIDIYALSLVQKSLLEAWQFQRTFSDTDTTKERLLEKILEWCISPNPRSGPLYSLLSLPLSHFEEQFLHKYALEPPKTLSNQSISVLRDLVCVRLIQSGNYSVAIKIDHQFAASTLNESTADSQDRRKMIRDIYDALPAAERLLLDSEIDGVTVGKGTMGDVDISQSWEDIPRPAPSGSAISPLHSTIPPATTTPIPERSGALRFSGSKSSPGLKITGPPPLIPVSTPTRAADGHGVFPGPGTDVPPASLRAGQFKPRSSLTQTTPVQLFLSGGASPATGGLKFTSSPQKFKAPLPPLFPSRSNVIGQARAMRRQNAFYDPPLPRDESTGIKRAFDATGTPAGDIDMEEDEAVSDVQEDEAGHDHYAGSGKKKHSLRRDEGEGEEDDEGFQYSLFTNVLDAHDDLANTIQETPILPGEKISRQIPPGAFMIDDEDEEATLAPSPVAVRTAARSTRKSTAAKTPNTPKVSRRSTRHMHMEEARGERMLPGALIMDEDVEHEQEEEEKDDLVTPLRPQPSSTVRRAGRKSRTSSASDAGDVDGRAGAAERRRRSTRLSMVSVPVSPEQVSPRKKERGTKRAASGTSKASAATTVKKRR